MIYTCGPLTLRLEQCHYPACGHAPRRGRRHWLTDFRPRSSRAFGEGCTCVVDGSGHCGGDGGGGGAGGGSEIVESLEKRRKKHANSDSM